MADTRADKREDVGTGAVPEAGKVPGPGGTAGADGAAGAGREAGAESAEGASVEELASAFERAFGADPLDVEATTLDPEDVDGVAGGRRPGRECTYDTPAEAAERDADADLVESVVSSTPCWRGDFLTAESMVVRLPNGRNAHRDVIRHPGAVAVIALTDDGKLVLVHQWRSALEQVTLEIPAGKLEKGEDPLGAAARELEEETGYRAGRMAYLGPIAPAAGYSDEVLHLYMAMGLEFVGASPDDDEFLHVDLVDLPEMVDRVLDGRIIDSKTVVGVLLCDAIARRMEL